MSYPDKHAIEMYLNIHTHILCLVVTYRNANLNY